MSEILILVAAGTSCEEGTCLIARYLMGTEEETWAMFGRDCPSRTVGWTPAG